MNTQRIIDKIHATFPELRHVVDKDKLVKLLMRDNHLIAYSLACELLESEKYTQQIHK